MNVHANSIILIISDIYRAGAGTTANEAGVVVHEIPQGWLPGFAQVHTHTHTHTHTHARTPVQARPPATRVWLIWEMNWLAVPSALICMPGCDVPIRQPSKPNELNRRRKALLQHRCFQHCLWSQIILPAQVSTPTYNTPTHVCTHHTHTCAYVCVCVCVCVRVCVVRAYVYGCVICGGRDLRWTRMHAHTYTRTHTHVRTHHTHTHTHARTHAHVHMHTYARTRAQTNVHTNPLTYIHMHACTHTHSRTHTYAHTTPTYSRTRAHRQTYTHIYTRTYARTTHAHTYALTHIHTRAYVRTHTHTHVSTHHTHRHT